jgi:hypothetical protein
VVSALSSGLQPITGEGEKVCALIDEIAGFLAEQAQRNDGPGRFAAASVVALSDAGLVAGCAPVGPRSVERRVGKGCDRPWRPR